MTDQQDELLRTARTLLPGGSLGTYFLPEEVDLVVAHGRGARVWDLLGREYVDWVLGSGPLILGHAHPAVVKAVTVQVERGATYYALNEPVIRLAETIVAASRCAEQIKFCSDGAEATFYALRLARAFTGREKIVRFEGAYHGHHDYAMVGGSPRRLLDYPWAEIDSAGVPRCVADTVLVAPYNDLDTTRRILSQHQAEIAAVLVEPIQRAIPPAAGFLEGVREATKAIGALFILDEIVTGFRLAYGGAQEYYGVTPDLACYGKIVGGGYPLAAVAGPREVLNLANPRQADQPRYVFFTGTLNGNAIASAAGLATIAELSAPGTYRRLHALGQAARDGLRSIFETSGIACQVLGDGPMFQLLFVANPVRNYRDSLSEAKARRTRLTIELLRRGQLINPWKAYISLAHTDEDVTRLLAEVKAVVASGVLG